LWRRGNLLPFPGIETRPSRLSSSMYGLSYQAVQSVESQPAFWRNISSPSSFTACFMLVSCLAWQHFPPKRWLTFNGLHGIISQMTEFFITTAVRTSNLTYSLLTNTHFRSLLFRQMHRSGGSLNERRRRRQTDTWLNISAETVDSNFASSYSVVQYNNSI
jgi:hypothetical protein